MKDLRRSRVAVAAVLLVGSQDILAFNQSAQVSPASGISATSSTTVLVDDYLTYAMVWHVGEITYDWSYVTGYNYSPAVGQVGGPTTVTNSSGLPSAPFPGEYCAYAYANAQYRWGGWAYPYTDEDCFIVESSG